MKKIFLFAIALLFLTGVGCQTIPTEENNQTEPIVPEAPSNLSEQIKTEIEIAPPSKVETSVTIQ